MLNSNEEVYVVVRLLSGEQLMAVLKAETEDHIELMYPMTVKSIPFLVDDEVRERFSASPFCQFSGDVEYSIPKSAIMFTKKLHESLVQQFLSLIENNEKLVAVVRDSEGYVQEETYYEDENLADLTTEELEEKILALESILGTPKPRFKTEDLENTFFIEGNETIN